MTILENIIDDIENKKDDAQKRYIRTKTGWNNLPGSDDIVESYCKNLLSTIIAVTKVSQNSEHRGKTITLVKKENRIWAYRGEELLERLIFILNDELNNQANLDTGACKEAIDLIGNETIYELKPWESDNNPLYACVELLKNYYLCDTIRHAIKNLVILAPKEYFENFEKSFTNFINFKNKLNEELKQENARIVIKSIDIEQKEIDAIIEQIGSKLTEWEKVIDTDKYEYKQTINLMDYIEYFKPIEEKLLIKNFKDVD